MVCELKGVKIASTCTANMEISIYKVIYQEIEVTLFMSYVRVAGCVAIIEAVFAMGVEKIIIFGTCGVLNSSIVGCSIIITNMEIRYKDTSLHYAPPSDEIAVNLKYLDIFANILEKHKLKYTIGKVWTTDRIYRKIREKTRYKGISILKYTILVCDEIKVDNTIAHFFMFIINTCLKQNLINIFKSYKII